ncbi:MAG: PDZ domain-containing protein [Bacteroidota bacterium]
MKKYFIFIFLLLFVLDVNSQNILRKAYMGIKTSELTDSIAKSLGVKEKNGVLVNEVLPSSTGEKLQLQKNDVILKINSAITLTVKDYQSTVKNIRENDTVALLVSRGKNEKLLLAQAVGKAYETSESYDVIYDEVKFMEGYLRIIVNKPKAEGKHKTILFIPGYMCYSLDNIGKHPYGQLVQKFCEKGYVVVRVEKPGEGDNTNTPDCKEIGFNTETDAFSAGYEKLKTYNFVDTSNIFIFGHSLGAIEAPVLAAKYQPKGIVLCGTSSVSWFEYIISMFRFQNIITGADYVENEKLIKQITPLLYKLLVEKQTPFELAKNPEYETLLSTWMEYDGGDHIWARHYSFWQELQEVNQPHLLKTYNGYVLSVRGAGDFEAFSTEDHQKIADIVNAYHPGHGTFKLIPNMDHAFAKSNTPEESYKNGLTQGYYYNNFNNAIIKKVDDWINTLK